MALLLLLGGCGLSTQPGDDPTSAPATAYLVVEVTPYGSQIFVDGMRTGNTPATIALGPGQHTLRVEHEGFEPLIETVTLTADAESQIGGELSPLSAAPAASVTQTPPGQSGSGQPLPDLAIKHAQIELETGGACDFTSTSLGIRVWIENLGSAEAEPFVVEANGIQQMVAGGLDAGGAITLWFAGYAPNGENTVSVDADDRIQESHEDNNGLYSRLPVPTLPPTCTPPASRPEVTATAAATAAPTRIAPTATPPASQPTATAAATASPAPTVIAATATPPPPPTAAAVTMRDGQISISTYTYVNFTSEGWNGTFNMPYTILDRVGYEASSPSPAEVSYRTFIVENEYLRLTFLPEVGGRLYKVLYKPTGHLVTYANPVLKPSPWGPPEQGWWLAAGGFEWCLPVEEHGYEWNVPWRLSATGDGQSVTVTLRDSDARDRVQAEIAVRLEAGAAYFTIRPRLENPTGAPLELKYWTNAMLAPGGRNRPSADLRFVLPDSVTSVTVHSRGDESLPNYNERMSWPIVNGTDLSRLGNWNRWLGFFEDPAASGFAAAYDEGYDEGIVRIYSADATPGSKVFAFGWQDPIPWSNWTDDGSSYIELHSGPAPTFDDSVTVPAGGHLQWTETWYPVAGLGGLRCACTTAALNLSASGDQAHVAVAVPRSWSGDVVLSLDGHELWREAVALVPGQPLLNAVELAASSEGRLAVYLETPDGTTLSECRAELDLR